MKEISKPIDYLSPDNMLKKTKMGGGKKQHQNDAAKKERYNSLDVLRTLACIGIVLMHIRSNIAVKPTKSFLTENIIAFTGNFVLLFMMISAFSMCCGYYQRFRESTITPQQFYSKRYVRVWPFFALLVLIDIVMTFFGERSLTENMVQELADGFADLTLVFGLLPNAEIKVIGVGWFLGLIFVFYMLFPFFVYLLDTKRKAWIILLVSIILFFLSNKYLGGINSKNIIFCAPYFISGGIVYLYRHSIMKVMQNHLVYCGYIAAVSLYTILFFSFVDLRFPLASNLLLYMLWLILAIGADSHKPFSMRVVSFFSNISMEIYLCHMVVFRAIEKLHLENKISDNDLNYWLTCLLVLSGSVCFASAWKRYNYRCLFPQITIHRAANSDSSRIPTYWKASFIMI